MRCSFCQNGDISTDKDNGISITPDLLALMIWQLRWKAVITTTNWVGGDPTIHLHTIVQAISMLDTFKMPIIKSNREELNYIEAIKADNYNNYFSKWSKNSEYAFYKIVKVYSKNKKELNSFAYRNQKLEDAKPTMFS